MLRKEDYVHSGVAHPYEVLIAGEHRDASRETGRRDPQVVVAAWTPAPATKDVSAKNSSRPWRLTPMIR